MFIPRARAPADNVSDLEQGHQPGGLVARGRAASARACIDGIISAEALPYTCDMILLPGALSVANTIV